jgi:hypothetical protein
MTWVRLIATMNTCRCVGAVGPALLSGFAHSQLS